MSVCMRLAKSVSAYFLCASGAVVSVWVSRPPPSILTLSSRLSKIKASPVTVPRSGSDNLGGAPALPVSTYSPVAPEYTSWFPVPRRPCKVRITWPVAFMRLTWAAAPPPWAVAPLASRLAAGINSSSTASDDEVAVPVSAITAPSEPARITALRAASEYLSSPPRTRMTEGVDKEWPASSSTFDLAPPLPALSITTRTGSDGSLLCASRVCRRWFRTITGPLTKFVSCQRRAAPRKVASPIDWFNRASSATTCAGPLPPKGTPGATASPAAPLPGEPARTSAHVAFTLPRAHASPDCRDTSTRSAVNCTAPFSTRGLMDKCSHSPLPSDTALPAVAWRGGCGSAPAFCAGWSMSTTFPSSSAVWTPAGAAPLPALVNSACSRSPVAVCRAPCAVVSSIRAWPSPLTERNTEPAAKDPATWSADNVEGDGGALPRWLALVMVTPPEPRIESTSNCPFSFCPCAVLVVERKPISTMGERQVRLTRRAGGEVMSALAVWLDSSLFISTPRSRCALFS